MSASSHFNNLLAQVPDLRERSLLDLGSGRGEFLVEAASQGLRVVGLEKNTVYINEANRHAKEAGVALGVVEGLAEAMPFADNEFDFINIAEVIEHVENPKKMLDEVYRVMKKGGVAYLSVPSRYGIKDPHFHLYGVNWIPRRFSDWFLSIFGAHKEYSMEAGHQRLRDMHYYTYSQAVALAASCGFVVEDSRERKLRKRINRSTPQAFVMMAYKILRGFYFDTFHFFIKKP